MLKQRILTAAILIPLVIWGLLKLPNTWFMDLTILVAIWGAYEWTQFIPLKTYGAKFGFMLTVVLVIFALMLLSIPSIYILAVGLLGWIDGIYLVFRKQKNDLPARATNSLYRAWLGLIVLVPFWVALNTLRTSTYGPIWLLYGMSIVWVADIVAYFVGRACGKHKLASNVSPKKTWEGVAGGLLGAVLAGIIWNWALNVPGSLYLIVLIIVAITAGLSVLGDLLESMLKRMVNIKDSGVLLPGHGGLLDRIDALTIALPIFALFSLLFLL